MSPDAERRRALSRAISRREAIRRATVIAGGVALVGSGALVACTAEKREPERRAAGRRGRALDPGEVDLAEAVADTILPDTPASPGARAAGAGAAMNLLLTDCYDEAAQRRARDGLAALRARCRDCEFASLERAQRERLLREIDAEAQRAGPTHWFHLVHELSTRAYFTSEVGVTKALRWTLVPGRWEGCVPLRPGQPAWA